MGHRPPDGPLGRAQHLEDRRTHARAQVQHGGRSRALEILQRPHVRVGQVDHVHVLADCRPVRCRVIRAEDLQRPTPPEYRLHEQRDQVDRDGPSSPIDPSGHAPAALKWRRLTERRPRQRSYQPRTRSVMALLSP